MPKIDLAFNNYLPDELKSMHSNRKNALLNLILSHFEPKVKLSNNDMNKFLRKVRAKSIALQETLDQINEVKDDFYESQKP